MGLFRNENVILGASSQIVENSGYTSAGGNAPVVSQSFKPGTREMVDMQFSATGSHGQVLGYLFEAPWQCQVVAVRENHQTASSIASLLTIQRIVGDGVSPVVFGSANGTTQINLTAAAINLQNAANTRQEVALSTAAGQPLILNAGDQIAFVISAAPTTLVGGNCQIEIAQIG